MRDSDGVWRSPPFYRPSARGLQAAGALALWLIVAIFLEARQPATLGMTSNWSVQHSYLQQFVDMDSGGGFARVTRLPSECQPVRRGGGFVAISLIGILTAALVLRRKRVSPLHLVCFVALATVAFWSYTWRPSESIRVCAFLPATLRELGTAHAGEAWFLPPDLWPKDATQGDHPAPWATGGRITAIVPTDFGARYEVAPAAPGDDDRWSEIEDFIEAHWRYLDDLCLAAALQSKEEPEVRANVSVDDGSRNFGLIAQETPPRHWPAVTRLTGIDYSTFKRANLLLWLPPR